MIYKYNECLSLYKSDYQIKKAIKEGKIYKISKGVYSDEDNRFHELSIIRKKYPKAVFTMNSAFYYHDLTDVIPNCYCLETNKDAAKIKDINVKQYYDNNNSLDLGVEIIKYCGEEILIFSKERMLVELIRNRTKFSFDYYKEIINNYREIINTLNIRLVIKYAERLPKAKLVLDVIQKEVL